MNDESPLCPWRIPVLNSAFVILNSEFGSFMKQTFTTRSEAETIEIGQSIAQKLPENAVVQLVGDLGAGKTFLVKAIASVLGADPHHVSSPSFAIIHEYPLPGKPTMIHIDGYRLSTHRHEWEEIGIPELLRGPGLKFVEWPNEELASLGEHVVDIRITMNDDDSRTIEVEGLKSEE